MNARYEDELRIAERAAEWHAVLNASPDGLDDAKCSLFMEWLEESPKHVREFLLLQALDVETQGIDSHRQIDIDELFSRSSANVVVLEGMPSHTTSLSTSVKKCHKRRTLWRWSAGLAAATAVAAIAIWQFGAAGQVYSTEVGELHAVKLSDGSQMELHTASRVRLNFSESLREVYLLQGEALFNVQHDANRPFRVISGASVIQAIGTKFNVNRRPLGTTVAVIEGKVRVYSSTGKQGEETREVLAAGEQARLDVRGKIQKREAIEDMSRIALRERRLEFRDDPLADIAAEFNRYNRDVQILVEGEAARHKRYGGIFDADDPESIARFVAHDKDLVVSRANGRIEIRARD